MVRFWVGFLEGGEVVGLAWGLGGVGSGVGNTSDLLHAFGARASFLFPTRVLFFPRLWARGVCAG